MYLKTKERHTKGLNDTEDTFIDFDSFCKKIDQSCFYCGKLKSSYKKDRITEFILYYNGLNRIDSSIGYKDDNTVPSYKMCNIAKSEMTLEEFKFFFDKDSRLSNIYKGGIICLRR